MRSYANFQCFLCRIQFLLGNHLPVPQCLLSLHFFAGIGCTRLRGIEPGLKICRIQPGQQVSRGNDHAL